MSERDAYLNDEAEHALIRGVASASDFNGQEFLDRASSLGIHFSDELVLLVTRPDAGLEMTPEDDLITELVHACRAVLAETDCPGVVGRVAELATRAIRLVIQEFRTEVTKTRKDGSRGALGLTIATRGSPTSPSRGYGSSS